MKAGKEDTSTQKLSRPSEETLRATSIAALFFCGSGTRPFLPPTVAHITPSIMGLRVHQTAKELERALKKSDLSKAKKKLLSTVYCRILTGSECSIDALVADLNVDQVYVKNLCDEAKQDGLLAKKGDQYLLTDVGRSKIIIVLAGGVFDIIHPGHVYTLSAAKALGDVLVVSVARDQTALASKGHPLNDEKQRAGLVGSLKYVDVALLGSETDIFETVVKVQPDIIAIGYDQKHDEKILAEETKKRGIKVKVVRLGSPIPHVKSSSIVKNQEVMKEF